MLFQHLQRTELEPTSSQEAKNGATAEFQACIQQRGCKEESAEGEEEVLCLTFEPTIPVSTGIFDLMVSVQ